MSNRKLVVLVLLTASIQTAEPFAGSREQISRWSSLRESALETTDHGEGSVSNPSVSSVIIGICTGPDCLVDGATDCRLLMEQALASRGKTPDGQPLIQLQDRPCMGPCGDGPNLLIMDGAKKRVKLTELQQELQSTASVEGGGGGKSLVPAEMFGAPVQYVCSVRNSQQAKMVVDFALHQQGSGCEETSVLSGDERSDVEAFGPAVQVVTPTRPWWDRPRNERLMLQRFAMLLILLGLYDKVRSDALTSEAIGIAVVLWVLSNFIMKDNLIEQLLRRRSE